MEFKDYYATLGLPKSATGKDVKQAYRKLARKFHPDVNPGDRAAETRFKEVNEANEVLGDPEKRKKYDELGANWRLYEQAQQAGQREAPFDLGSVFGGRWNVHVGTAQGGYGPVVDEAMGGAFAGQDPFSDFFKTFFGGNAHEEERRGPRGGRASRARAGHDTELEIALSLEEAYNGVTRRFSIKHDGKSRTVDVRIPAGIKDGARVRVAGEGRMGTGGAASGDLYLRVRLHPHPQFERRDRDLYVRVPITVTTVVLGGEVEVPKLASPPLRLKIPAETQQGQLLRLKGHGMPVVGKPDERGDLYVTIDVQVPRNLTAEERKHYEALAALGKDKKNRFAGQADRQ